MGVYIYRLKNKFSNVEINGKIEQVYHLTYWWKPGWNFLDDDDPYKPKNYYAVCAKLAKSLKNANVKYVAVYGSKNKYPITEVMTWTFQDAVHCDDSVFGTEKIQIIKLAKPFGTKKQLENLLQI